MYVIENLQEYLLNRLEEYPSPHAMAVANGWSYGLVYRGLAGHESDTLRKQIGCLKHPPRPRLIVNNCPPELKSQFDAIAAAENVSRAELLAWMVRNHIEFSGWGDYRELEY